MSAVVKQLSAAALSRNVDKLGALNAQIALLAKQADAIKADLKAIGAGEYFGKSFKAVVSDRETPRLDSAKVKALLSPAQIVSCTAVSKSVAVSLYDL